VFFIAAQIDNTSINVGLRLMLLVVYRAMRPRCVIYVSIEGDQGNI
jgi:hypothetical protein